MVPAPLSIAVTVPCPLARIGVAAAGAIAILSVLPVISEESGVSAFWPQAAVRPARPKTRLNRKMYIVFSFMKRDWLSAGATTDKLLAERAWRAAVRRSEEHTSELQSLMRISYAVFCLK